MKKTKLYKLIHSVANHSCTHLYITLKKNRHSYEFPAQQISISGSIYADGCPLTRVGSGRFRPFSDSSVINAWYRRHFYGIRHRISFLIQELKKNGFRLFFLLLWFFKKDSFVLNSYRCSFPFIREIIRHTPYPDFFTSSVCYSS